MDDAALHAVLAELALHATSESLLSGRACDAAWPNEPEWEAYLLALPEETLALCERSGLHRVSNNLLPLMPASLRALCDTVASASIALGRRHSLDGGGGCSTCCAWRQSAEKAEQVEALLGTVTANLSGWRIRRVVDVGCGKGHLTAKLQRALDVPALGLDVDATLIETAQALYPHVSFEVRDLVQQGLECAEGDLIVGLHPCGALGEAIVRAVAGAAATHRQEARPPSQSSEGRESPEAASAANSAGDAGDCQPCDGSEDDDGHGSGASNHVNHGTDGAALLMVPCCWHKQNGLWREPLSLAMLATAAGGSTAEASAAGASTCAAPLRFPLKALKKASMALDASTSLTGRRARAELREVLRVRGVDEAELKARREMDGIHPRKARRGLPVLAEEALRLRQLPPATDAELTAAVDAARIPFERSRRLSLLEPVLGELIELLCTLDRALALHEAGLRTRVFRAFEAGASDRNLAILAQPNGGTGSAD